jgi:hypothetical protein
MQRVSKEVEQSFSIDVSYIASVGWLKQARDQGLVSRAVPGTG